MSLQEKERERAAEQWLDEAIGHLRDTGPRTGLETRVLAGLRAHVAQRRRRWTFLVAATAAALLVAALLANWQRSKPANAPEIVLQKPPAQSSTTSAATVAGRTPKAHRPRTTEHSDLAARDSAPRSSGMNAIEARRDFFPSPAPLTEQGKLLQAYLRQTPPHELALVAARQPSLSSLESENLNIAPLQIADLTPKAEETKDRDQN